MISDEFHTSIAVNVRFHRKSVLIENIDRNQIGERAGAQENPLTSIFRSVAASTNVGNAAIPNSASDDGNSLGVVGECEALS